MKVRSYSLVPSPYLVHIQTYCLWISWSHRQRRQLNLSLTLLLVMVRDLHASVEHENSIRLGGIVGVACLEVTVPPLILRRNSLAASAVCCQEI